MPKPENKRKALEELAREGYRASATRWMLENAKNPEGVTLREWVQTYWPDVADPSDPEHGYDFVREWRGGKPPGEFPTGEDPIFYHPWEGRISRKSGREPPLLKAPTGFRERYHRSMKPEELFRPPAKKHAPPPGFTGSDQHGPPDPRIAERIRKNVPGQVQWDIPEGGR